MSFKDQLNNTLKDRLDTSKQTKQNVQLDNEIRKFVKTLKPLSKNELIKKIEQFYKLTDTDKHKLKNMNKSKIREQVVVFYHRNMKKIHNEADSELQKHGFDSIDDMKDTVIGTLNKIGEEK